MIFRDHLLTNICSCDERLFQYLFAWFAQMVQKPREKPGVAIVLRGKRGTGKTTVGEVFGRLIRQHYYQVDSPTYITGRFNFHLASCLLLGADEATWAGDKAAEGRLKGLITAPFQMIEPKYLDATRVANHVRLLMTTNENWAIPAGPDERRFLVLDVNDRCAQNHPYFAEMRRQLEDGGFEALLHDLLNLDLTAINLFEALKRLLCSTRRSAASTRSRLGGSIGSKLGPRCAAQTHGTRLSGARSCSTTSLPPQTEWGSEGKRRKRFSESSSSALFLVRQTAAYHRNSPSLALQNPKPAKLPRRLGRNHAAA